MQRNSQRQQSKKTKKKGMHVGRILTLFLLVGILLFCVGKMAMQTGEYKAGEEEYTSLAVAAGIAEPLEKDSTGEKDTAEESVERKKAYQIDFKALAEINADIAGWILIEDTQVNYPIVKSKDNEDYLNTTFEGKKNGCGTLFIDCENSADWTDKVTIVYGHNMKNGTMFKTLNYYSEESYYEEHPQVLIFTPSATMVCNIISVHTTTYSSLTYTREFTQESYIQYLSNEKGSSLYETKVPFDSEKQTIVLSTCRGNNHAQRFVMLLQPE